MHRLHHFTLVLAFGILSACGTTPATPGDIVPTSQQPLVTQQAAEPTAPASTQTDPILAAAETAIQAVELTTPGTLRVEQVEGDYARLQWTPDDPNATDPSYIFVRRTNDIWKPIAGPGTAFGPDDLQPYGVPESLWLDAPQVMAQRELCSTVQPVIEQTLNVSTTAFITDVLDLASNTTKLGCQIAARGTGKTFSSPNETMRKLVGSLEAQGWQEDTAFAADGPVGTATGIRKGGVLGLLSVGWSPAPEANCPQDQSIDACTLAPEQQLYEITLSMAGDM